MKFLKILSLGPEKFHAKKRTDRNDEAIRRFSHFIKARKD